MLDELFQELFPLVEYACWVYAENTKWTENTKWPK